MGIDVDFIAGKEGLDKVSKLLSDQEHGKRGNIADDIIRFASAMKEKYSPQSPEYTLLMEYLEWHQKIGFHAHGDVTVKRFLEEKSSDDEDNE